MDDSQLFIAVEASRLAKRLPYAVMQNVCGLVGKFDLANWAASRSRIMSAIPHTEHRNLVGAFLDSWRGRAPQVSPETVAIALRTASECEKTHQEQQSIELVWTGPELRTAPFRRTEQAILQVLDSATERITLVSYAVYKIPFIGEALVRAAQRGVKIRVIIETPDRVAGHQEYSTMQALGLDVSACCAVYYWPKELRPQAEHGKIGILHVKCAVADGRSLFLSSANLTDYAFTINMELGVLITGGHLPRRVEECFEELVHAGVLQLP
jgi:phosphatidylserine/phosphatidylglycerophosphate/cardiolipin synthase-like enzyme